MEDKCCVCGETISELNEFDRLSHIDKCLDNELEKTTEEIENIDTQKYAKPIIQLEDKDIEYDFTGMPDYDHMPVSEIKNHLNDYGMKKTIETKLARVILKETCLYVNREIFPNFLTKFL